jgi:sugar O-acyltransferase (sialic acid O-acetyltransferase NeuD family)
MEQPFYKKKSNNVVIIGSSGHAKVVIDIIEKEDKYVIVGLIDTFKQIGETSYGYPILGSEESLPALVKSYNLRGGFIAIGDNWQRYLMAEKIKTMLPEFLFISTIHPSAQIARGVTIERGSILIAGAIANSDSKVGNFCILNTKASLGHDSIMEDFSSLSSNATIGANVRIGAFSAISLGANILSNRSVGKHTVVGAGALVYDDIPDCCVAYGMPAKIIRKRREGDEYL